MRKGDIKRKRHYERKISREGVLRFERGRSREGRTLRRKDTEGRTLRGEDAE